MIKLNPETELTAAIVKKLIDNHKQYDMPRLQKLEDYYLAKNEILKRILDGIKSDSFIQITTSDQVFETVMYTDVIFDRLELESKKFRSEDRR